MTKGKCLLIAEIGQAHDGSIGLAASYVDAVANIGVDLIKFQMHNAEEESTQDEPFRTKFSLEDASRMDYWRRMEFTHDQWQIIFDRAQNKNLSFIASAFSPSAVTRLAELGVPAIKIASGDVTNTDILDAVIDAGLPTYLSSGMSTWAEIDKAVEKLCSGGIELTVMQCTSAYPTAMADVGLNNIQEIRNRYSTKIGLSDHSGTLYPALAAIAMSVDVVEVHVVFDRMMFGPDASSSLAINDLKFLIDYRNAVREMTDNPVDKDCMAEKLSDIRRLFLRSLAPSKNLVKGDVLTKDVLSLKKPGFGIPADDIGLVIGKKLKEDVSMNRLLRWDDIVD